jgi:hypothetical protein
MKSLTKHYRELSVIIGIIAGLGISHAGDLTGYDSDGDGLIDYLDDQGNLWPNQQAWEASVAFVSTITGDNTAAVEVEQPAPDSDGDGLTDVEESTLGTNPLIADTDGGGLSDYEETHDEDWRATDPLNPADDMPSSSSQTGDDGMAQVQPNEAGGESSSDQQNQGFDSTEDAVVAGIELALLVVGALTATTPIGWICVVVGCILWGRSWGDEIGLAPNPGENDPLP